MLRIATDVSCQRADLPLVPMLHPFFRATDVGPGATTWDRRYAGYWQIADELFEVTEVDEADIVVIPADWYWVRGPSWASRPDRELAARCRALHERAKTAGKPTVVFFTGDRSCDHVPLDDAMVFREGGFRSRWTSLDRALPAFAEDLSDHFFDGELVERPKGPRPVVGFCGLAGRQRGLGTAARLVAFRAVVAARERRVDPSPRTGENLRSELLDLLAADPDVETNFVVRDTSVFFRNADTRDLVDVRREYVDNLATCDYVLCTRGSGNYSYRLYEALGMGRIPILVDTDLALPFADTIDWSSYCVVVAERDRRRLAHILREFHNSISADDFIERQHAARRLWLTHLSPEGFFKQLHSLTSL